MLERIRRGETIDQYETVRQRKNGSLFHISLTVSPIRNLHGNIVGASKIGRDMSERKRAEERQHLLLREMDHRIKNLFALAIGIVSLSGRSAKNVQDVIRSVRERLSALARAHALTLSHSPTDEPQGTNLTTLHLSFGRSSRLTRTSRMPRAHKLRSLDQTSRLPTLRSRVWRFYCTNLQQIQQNMERSQYQEDESRLSAPNTAKHSSSHGRSSADPRSPPRQTAKGLARASLARRLRANSVGRSPETGGPKDSLSGYPYPASV